MSDDNKSADEVMEKFKPLEMKPMTNVQQLQQQLAEKDKRIAELEPLAKCALELGEIEIHREVPDEPFKTIAKVVWMDNVMYLRPNDYFPEIPDSGEKFRITVEKVSE